MFVMAMAGKYRRGRDVVGRVSMEESGMGGGPVGAGDLRQLASLSGARSCTCMCPINSQHPSASETSLLCVTLVLILVDTGGNGRDPLCNLQHRYYAIRYFTRTSAVLPLLLHFQSVSVCSTL